MSDRETAKKLGLEIEEDLSKYKFVRDNTNLIPYAFAKGHYLLPVDEQNNTIVVALCNPSNFSALSELELMVEKELKPIYCSKEILEKAIERCYKQTEETKSIFSSYEKDPDETRKTDDLEGYDLLSSINEDPTVRMLNAIIVDAIQQGSSDIHFEPGENDLSLRYRVDGILQKRSSPPKEYQTQLITRIKVMAKLDIAEKRMPQDGRIKLMMAGREIDFRVSTLPVVYGERIVLRILDKGNIVRGLENIGMSKNILEGFRKLISMPEGIILVTGPTGSGKTTTLYSAIEEISSSEINIMTIEDPVEYKIASIAQIGVNPKINLTFAAGLRHILRQDPDAIMIGEIRDLETAEIAIQAALTGHLVLSTLHTNDAPSAIARLADMGIEPYLLSSAIVGVLAQRLVRKICPHCKSSYEPTAAELKGLNLKRKDVNQFYKGKGCDFCFHTGYKGRVGIYELMVLTPKIKKQLMKSLEVETLKEAAKEENMIDLSSSGALLVKDGITTTAEVFRVAKTLDMSED